MARNAESVAFLGMMMFAGTFWGYIEAFLFWYLDDLGAPKHLMGWTVAVGMVTSLPFLIFSGPITDTIGHMNVIILGMLAYSCRMLGYSFIPAGQPVYVYPFEALEGLTMALMMTSAVTYVAKISTPTTIASVMGMMGALFFGVGKGSGSLFGGILMSYIGAPNTFRYFAVNAMVCALVYGFFQCLYVRPKRNREEAGKNRMDSEVPPPPPSTKTNGGLDNPGFAHHNPGAGTTGSGQGPTLPSSAALSGMASNASLATSGLHMRSSENILDDTVDHGRGMGSNRNLASEIEPVVVNTGPRSITGGTRV